MAMSRNPSDRIVHTGGGRAIPVADPTTTTDKETIKSDKVSLQQHGDLTIQASTPLPNAVSASLSFPSLASSNDTIPNHSEDNDDFRDDYETRVVNEESYEALGVEVTITGHQEDDFYMDDEFEINSAHRRAISTRRFNQWLEDDTLRLRRTCEWLARVADDERSVLLVERTKFLMARRNLQAQVEMIEEDNAFLSDKEAMLQAKIVELTMESAYRNSQLKALEDKHEAYKKK